MSDNWYYSFDGEHYNWGEFSSKQEAIEEARKHALEDQIKVFWVGKASEVPTPSIDVISLLEQIAEEAIQDTYGDYGLDYLDDVTKEHETELGKQLNEVWHKWVEKRGYKPTWFIVRDEDVREISLEDDMGGK
ncbi:hypothetical protein NSA24_00690 [Clostridioides mangenotii]|uniref:hypothetical protein n=1 Tax=Metaclostridioides mangenotii TaxID=1540 RepID=UPI002149D5CD|nr:hypothetical protein [Clostridioides mangenotii]MCR1953343.1 hypothetical protein [Clostridioides mangenotii]